MKNYIIFFVFIAITNKAMGQNVLTIKDDGTTVYFTDVELKQHKDKCVDGIRIVIDSSSVILSESRYKNCFSNGLSRLYYSSGLIKEQGYYVDGKKDGKWYLWNDDGTLKCIDVYEKGVLKYD
jgi:antitoxin component YwqK of YwqJK toxin-antitoxin module